MATSILIPIEEYLDTSYRPDREYIDGEVVERNLGKFEHGRIQSLLVLWFGQFERQWNIITVTEWRTRVSATRVRIPDLVLVRRGRQDDVLQDAPLLFIEILSPDDSYSALQQRAEDYLQMGAKTIWVIDPATRTARMSTGQGWVHAQRLEVAGTPIFVELDALFARLDEDGA